MRVQRLPLAGTNAFLVSGERHVLVDTGPARARTALMDGLAKLGVRGEDLALVLATHAHATSVGNAAFLQRTFGVPVAVHGADAPILATGIDRRAPITEPVSALMHWIGDRRFDAVNPDVVFGHTMSLYQYGIDATVVHTPGHTIGSASVLVQTGDAIVGDLLMGGSFGGRVSPWYPHRHYFAEVPARVPRSLALLKRLGVQRLHPGTGTVLAISAVHERFIAHVRSMPSGPAPARLRERRLNQQPWFTPVLS
jgi:hydroxyacylglutathione hydrolase